MLDEVLNQPATEVGPTVTQEGGTSESGPTVTSVAKDIGHGIIEAPVQTFGGVSDAARETFEALGSVADWFEENIGGTLPGTGIEAIDRPLDALAKLMPDIDAADSVTGNLFRKTSQFIAGFLGAGKFIKAKGVVGAMTKGAAADAVVMDPHEDRLSNLVQEYPALKNPVSDFLSARPTDTEALGRFKNAVEGLGLGAVADGFMLSLKAIRAGRKVKAAAQEPEAPSLLPEEAKQVFDPDGPRTTTKDGRIYINMARIDSTDDIKVLMQEMADRKYADIDKARRGKRTHGETEAAADTIDAFDVLLNKRSADPSVTKPLTAEETVAARRLWTASAEQLMDIAEAASKNPSEVNLVGFRKAMAAHDAISKEVLAVRAETARALDSWKIPAGGGKEQMRHLQNALDMHGGADVSRELATRIAAMRGADLGDLDDVVRGTVGARTRDAVIEGWVMGLLSGPKTHLVNTMSNTSVLFQQIGERAVAARLGRVLGTDGGVQVGEAMAQTFGMLQGLKDAFRFVGRSFRTGKSGFGVGKVGLPRQGAISSESFNIASDTWIGRVVDFLGTAVRIPGRALGAEDEFFKTLGYRMELNARALRQASEEVHGGKVAPDKLKERIAELVENPPEDLRLAATDAALYQTFTNRTGAFADSLRKMADADPSGFSRVLLSFIRTPSNIMKFTFERTPLAPLMSQVRAGMAAGGARKDLALARMATGSAMMLAAADLTMSGAITGKGPDNPSRRSAKQRQGWQPYSVKIGDRYFAFNRMDPIGMTLGLAADAVEILQNSDGSKPKAAEEAIIAAVASIANNMTSKTYLRGASQFFKMMSNPTRFSESYVQRLLRTAIPTAAAEVARGVDPYLRETRSIMDSLRRRTPGISKELPAVRDLWGAPIEFRSGLGWAYDAVSPIYSRREKASPIDKEILRLGMNITKPPRVISIDGITVDLDKHKGAYSRYVELAGNELKHPAWGIGAKDYLDALIKGQHPLAEVYKMRSDGPDGSKADMVRATVLDYRAHARRQLLEEYPSISAEISAARMDRLHQVHQVQ